MLKIEYQDPVIEIGWHIFDLLVSECNWVGSQYGILTDEHHMSILYFPPNGPPEPYHLLDLDYNYFIRNLSVADSPLCRTIAACVLFSVSAGSLKLLRRFNLCRGALHDPVCLNDSFSTEPEILQSFCSYHDFDLYTL